MFWKNEETHIRVFDAYNYKQWLRCQVGGLSYTPGSPFNVNLGWTFRGYERCIPKIDISSIKQQFVTKVNSDSILYFDESSKFPRYKLTIGTNKRCIKPVKANFIVVNDFNKPFTISNSYYLFKNNINDYFMISENDYDMEFNRTLSNLINRVTPFQELGDLELVYSGPIMLLDKTNNYIFKWMNGDYTQSFITDENLDKQLNELCPEPTVEELNSIVEMLDSDDDSVVKLGTKMLSGYNVTKYPLTFRLILLTRNKWWMWTRSTVSTKQMVDSLHINGRNVSDNFSYALYYIEEDGFEYTAEDIALAKQVCIPMVENYLMEQWKNLSRNHYQFLPNHVKITAE